MLRRGDCRQAAEWARDRLRSNQVIPDWRVRTACLVALASVACTQGQPARAVQL
jgi:hypothetical protein